MLGYLHCKTISDIININHFSEYFTLVGEYLFRCSTNGLTGLDSKIEFLLKIYLEEKRRMLL